MKTLVLLLTSVSLCFFIAGCSDPKPKPKRLTLYSIDGKVHPRGNEKEVSETFFHGYPIIGSTTFKDSAKCTEILNALDKGRKDSDGKAAKCFWPRHGIHVEYEDGRKVDFVVCFTCLQLEVFEGGAKVRDTTTKTPMEYFNKQL